MQLAALAAVVVYFWADIAGVTASFLGALAGGRRDTPEFRLGAGIVLATIPIAIAGAALSGVLNRCGSPLRHHVVNGPIPTTSFSLIKPTGEIPRSCEIR